MPKIRRMRIGVRRPDRRTTSTHSAWGGDPPKKDGPHWSGGTHVRPPPTKKPNGPKTKLKPDKKPKK